jgi:hypothetical protein
MARGNPVSVGGESVARSLRRRRSKREEMALMLDIQEEISKACEGTSGLRRETTRTAVKEYFRTLGAGGVAATADFDAARDRAMGVLKAGLFRVETLAVVAGERPLDDRAVAGLTLTFDAIATPLKIPHPPVAREPKVYTLALAALTGAAAGMLALASLFRWAYDMRDLGLVVGGPVGALLAVLIVHRLSRVRLLLRFLPGLSSDTRSLSGHARKDHEAVVLACVEQWMDWAVPTLAALCLHGSLSSEPQTKREAAFRRIGKLIYTLHKAGRESLPVVADELIQEARNYGFEGLDGPAAFSEDRGREQDAMIWKGALANKYETFGHIVEGDRVTVERPPVVFEGKVIDRGLVRKVRETT